MILAAPGDPPMPSSASDFASRRFSTASLPERQRLSFWRDFFGQEIVHCDIEVERDVSLRAEATLVALPELRAIWFSKDTPMRGRVQWSPTGMTLSPC